MKITKENLLVEVTKLRQSHEGWVSGDEIRRIEFAKAFGWTKRGGTYNDNYVYITPSWPQVFVEIGKLLANQQNLFNMTDITQMKIELQNLKEVSSKNSLNNKVILK